MNWPARTARPALSLWPWALGALWAVLCFPASKAASAASLDPAIALPEDAPECVRWAAAELEASLRARTVPGGVPKGAIRVRWIGPAGREPEPEAAAALSRRAESFLLRAAQGAPVRVTGRGAVGAMYGLLELAEQIEGAAPRRDWRSLRQALHPLSAQPAVRVRALNIFLHLRPDRQLADWFHDAVFWRRLLDLLAKSRFNTLDIHGAFAPATTAFSDLLPHFTHPGRSGAEALEHNRASLLRVVAAAKARGIRVGLLDYAKGSGRTSARRVRELLRAVPGLGLFGWRLKRRGEKAAGIFRQAYVQPARAAGFQGPWLTRSWGSDRKTIREVGRACGRKLWVEVKYNGEQLGLPYPAIHGWGADYSFQDYLRKPRPFQVIWQVRANGTHRVFSWADPDFARRAVLSFSLGGAAGFSIEPHWAYYSVDPARRFRHPEEAMGKGQRYLFERQWAWYMLWGRLAYDPATPERIFERAFIRRHGPRAGPAAFRTLRRMSRIVPEVFAAYAMGVDHRDAAPEMEIGLFPKYRRKGPRRLEALCAIRPLDRARACSPSEYAEALFAGDPEPRVNPLQAARRIEGFAEKTGTAAAALEALLAPSQDPAPLRSLAAEARALAELGRSTAARLRALTFYALFLRTQDARWLPRAVSEWTQAQAHWAELAQEADRLFLPVDDPLRMGKGFTWDSVLASFQRLGRRMRKDLDQARQRGRKTAGEPHLAGALRSERAAFASPRVIFTRKKGKLAIALHFPAGGSAPKRAVLLYKALRSEAPWERKRLEAHTIHAGRSGEKVGRTFRAKVSEPDGGLLFQFQALDAQGRGWLWPEAAKRMPYYWSRPAE